MKRFVLIALVLIVTVAAVLVYHTLSRPAPKAADLLPESTLLFVDVPDFTKSREEFRQTTAYALWNEPEIQALVAKPQTALQEAMGLGSPGKNGENEIATALLDALQGEVFLAVTHVSLLPQMQAGIVVGVDVKGKRFEAMAALYKLERRLKAQHPNAIFGVQTHLGAKYSVWEIRSGYPVCHATFNSLVVFTLGEDSMRGVIARFKGSPSTSEMALSASRRYQNMVNRMPQAYEVLGYLNAEAVGELLGPFMMLPQVSASLERLARLRAVGSSVKFLDGGVQDVSFAAYRRDAAPRPAPATLRKSLALTSPQTLFYAVGSDNLAEQYDGIMQSLTQSGSADLAAGAMQFEQTVRRRGVRIREDVLAYLGPETALIAGWREGARFPDVAVVAEVKDAARLKPALDDAFNSLKEITLGDDEKVRWDETDYRGHTLRAVPIGAGLIAPAYVLTDDFFILALTADYAKEFLDHAGQTAPTLASSHDYQKSMKRLPPKANSYTFCDLGGLFDPLYASARAELSALGADSVISADALPAAETISKHLFPFASATVAEDNSHTTTSFSPLGTPLTIVAGGALVAGIVVPHLPKSQNPFHSIPGAPTKFSGRAAPRSPPGNRTAESQIPANQ